VTATCYQAALGMQRGEVKESLTEAHIDAIDRGWRGYVVLVSEDRSRPKEAPRPRTEVVDEA
jgi:hypothetical protein